MTDYTELVKRLRAECALPYESIKTMREAADAIEELQQIAAHYEETAKDYFKDVCYYMERVPKWISVKDRLPQEHETVLAYCADDDFYYLSRMHKSFEDYEVTHWMPLPAPPKEET